MTAQDLVRQLHARGVQLTPRPSGKIYVEPLEKVTEAERDLLRAHRADVLELLAAQGPGSPPPLPVDGPGVRAVLGAHPTREALAQLEAEVRGAVLIYQDGVRTGHLGKGPLLVRGRPLCDFLNLDVIGRLIRD